MNGGAATNSRETKVFRGVCQRSNVNSLEKLGLSRVRPLRTPFFSDCCGLPACDIARATATDADLTIVEFGGFAWQDGKWVASSINGKPFTGEDFAEWYKCPKAVLKKGEAYSDPTNWSTAPELMAGKTRWNFIGVDGKGKRVKGEAVIELKGEIDPKKPKDPE